MPLLCTLPSDPINIPGPTITFDLHATRGHQRGQNKCGCPLQISLNFSNTRRGRRRQLQTDFQLMPPLSPGSLAPPLVTKCNSTGPQGQSSLSVQRKDRCRCCGRTPNTRADEGARTAVSQTEAPDENTRCLSVVELFAFFFKNTNHVRDCEFLSSSSPRVSSRKSTTASSKGGWLLETG